VVAALLSRHLHPNSTYGLGGASLRHAAVTGTWKLPWTLARASLHDLRHGGAACGHALVVTKALPNW
jgi:hypothetical protein